MRTIFAPPILFFFAVVAALTTAATAQAASFTPPAYQQPVMDEAQLLEPDAVDKLARALEAIHQKGGPQIGVLTVETIGDLTIEEASYQVAKAWKLGTAEKDNGVLLIIAQKERKVRIEVGQGVEGDLTDAYSRRIIDDTMVPLFKRGKYTDGVVLGLDGILKRMNPPIDLAEYINVRAAPARSGEVGLPDLVQFLIIIFVLFVLFGIGGGRGRRSNAISGLAGFLIGMNSGRHGGGWGGGGGGGFSGGGGGGFSGGGASGSW
jgi:uncharacterized protein